VDADEMHENCNLMRRQSIATGQVIVLYRHMNLKSLFVAGCLTLLAGISSGAEPTTTPTMIGFMQDSTGVAAGARPPISFDGLTGKNLLWKMPLPNHSHGSPIVVKGRVFVASCAGWPEGQDNMQLLCFEASTGKELWRRDLDEFATWPAERADQARALRRKYWEAVRMLARRMAEYQTADEARKQAILTEVAPWLGDKAKECYEKQYFGSGRGGEGWVVDAGPLGAELKKVCGYESVTWGHTSVDLLFAAPASDGERVSVITGRKTIHTFDLDGKPLWQVRQDDAKYSSEYTLDYTGSPMIVDGKLVFHAHDHVWGYNMRDGSLAWKTPAGVVQRHAMGSPIMLRLPRPGPAGTSEALLYTWTGDLIRIRDGKLLHQNLMVAEFGGMTTDGKDTLYVCTDVKKAVIKSKVAQHNIQLWNPGSTAQSLAAIRLRWSGPDTVAWEVRWSLQDKWYPYPVYHQGLLYNSSGAIYDAATGHLLKPVSLQPKANGLILTEDAAMFMSDGKMYTIPRDGERGRTSPVEDRKAIINDPANREKILSMVGRFENKDWYASWFDAVNVPFAVGDRLYARTFDYLYCFGPSTQGRPGEDAAVAASIRNENAEAALVARLADASPWYRMEAVKRLGHLKKPLSAAAVQALTTALEKDLYEDLRAECLRTLDACDPAGKAGWDALCALIRKAGPKERPVLAETLRVLGPQSAALMERHWEQLAADRALFDFLFQEACVRRWRVQPLFDIAVAALDGVIPTQPSLNPGKHPVHIQRMFSTLRGYLVALDAAADPAIRAKLLKAGSGDWSLHPTLLRHLEPAQALAWIEGCCVPNARDGSFHYAFLRALRVIGPEAIPAIERMTAELDAFIADMQKQEKKDDQGIGVRTAFNQKLRDLIPELKLHPRGRTTPMAAAIDSAAK
jgi:hypothetical protein